MSIRIAQLADLHFGAEDADALAAATERLEAVSPQAIIVCGDVTQRGKRSEFAAAQAWLERFDAPKLVVPGNHDTPLLNLYVRATDPFARFERYFAGNGVPIELGPWCAAGLNSARGWQARRNWAEGSINLDQLQAAIGEETSRPRLLACHHPFLSPPDTPLRTATRRGRRASQVLARSHVELLLTGHVHTPSAAVRTSPDGRYLAITAGTLSTRLRRAGPSLNFIDLGRETIEAHACHVGEGTPRTEPLGAWQRHTLEPVRVSEFDGV